MTRRAALPEVRLSTLARTLDHWLPRDDDADHLDLHAPYQRSSVWTVEQRRALVKSILMGLPIGAVVTSELPAYCTASFRVIDGKQRVETIRGFVTDEFTVPAWWFPEERVTSDAEMIVCSDLTVVGRRFLHNRPVPELMFRGETEWLDQKADKSGWNTRRRTPDELLRAEAEVFLLVNGAGTSQTADDLARAAAVAER